MRFATIRTGAGTTAARLDGDTLVPLAASDVGALREIIRPGVTGALAASGDPASFADIMEPLLDSADIRRKYGANAREWVARDRTWAHNASIYQAAYERLGAI